MDRPAPAIPTLPIRSAPFPHGLADGWLPDAHYRALASSFPDCPPASGPTGFTCFPGDPAYAALMKQPAWQKLHDLFHGQAFVDFVLGQFPDIFRSECIHDLSHARYVDYVESRADKESPRLGRVVHAPDELWVRMDIMQGWGGYDRKPHLDHRRRAATLLLYFCDADAIGMTGGDLLLHDRDGEVRATIRARENRAAMFPCHNASLHSVSPILQTRAPRNFVQVTLSSSVDLWAPAASPQSLWRRLARKGKALLG